MTADTNDNPRQAYRKRAGTEVVAVRLDLHTDGFTYQKWGGEQRCKAGDWVVLNDGDTYTIDAESFAATYEYVSPGRYRKSALIFAMRASEGGRVETKEGSTGYEAGDYLVSNDVSGTDSYAVAADIFERMYEPADL